MKVLVFGADGFEDLELFYPLHRLKEEGIDARVVSVSRGPLKVNTAIMLKRTCLLMRSIPMNTMHW